MAPAAEATIVYTPAQLIMSRLTTINLDLNGDGIVDFQAVNQITQLTSYEFATSLQIAAAQVGNGIVANQGERYFAARMRPDVPIGPMVFKQGTTRYGNLFKRYCVRACSSWSSIFGPWAGNVNFRYVGLKFLIQGETHYGWLRVDTRSAQGEAIITGYAYETVPNKPLLTGKTSGPDEPIPVSSVPHDPQPATLGMLAQGSSGLVAWRRTSGYPEV